MRKVNPGHVEKLIAALNAAPYYRLIPITVRELGYGYSVAEIALTERHHNNYGEVHGGVLSALVDTAASWALFYGVEDEDAGITSVSLNLGFLSPATGGRLVATGRQIKLGRTLGHAACDVTDSNGKRVAHGTLTVMVLPGKAPPVHPPSTPKFLD
jgi:uncharacterized protein (TIGR00369 family)